MNIDAYTSRASREIKTASELVFVVCMVVSHYHWFVPSYPLVRWIMTLVSQRSPRIFKLLGAEARIQASMFGHAAWKIGISSRILSNDAATNSNQYRHSGINKKSSNMNKNIIKWYKMHHQMCHVIVFLPPHPLSPWKTSILRYPQRNHLAGRVEIGAF